MNTIPRLRMNRAAMSADFRAAIERAADKLIAEYRNEIASGMRTQSGRSDLEISDAKNAVLKDVVQRYVIGRAHAIMDSYGTGSKMDKTNPALEDYMSSDLWNPARSDSAIRGRPEGEYVNIFGEDAYSKGTAEGLNLETMKNSPVTAREPSYAFQDAQAWFTTSGRVDEVLKATIHEFFSSVRNNPGAYFIFG